MERFTSVQMATQELEVWMFFSAAGNQTKWSEIEILNVPINSSADDVYFKKQPLDRYQILVRNREGSPSLWNSTCCDDIYEVFYPSIVEMILRIVNKELSLDPDVNIEPKLVEKAKAKIYLYDPITGEKHFIKSDSLINGISEISLDPGKIYLVEIEKPGFFTSSQIVDLRKSKINDMVDLELDINPWDEKPIAVPNIYFEFGNAEMTEKSKLAVDTSILV